MRKRELIRQAESAALNQPETVVELAALAEDVPSHVGLRHGLGPPATLVAVGLCGVFAFQCLYSTQPLLPLLQHLFAASKSAVALTVSACTLGVAFSAPIVGAFAQRLSRKKVVVASVALLSVPTLLAASSQSLHALIFWRLLQGLILPGIFATTIAYITEEWAPEQVPAVMSIYICGTVTGGFLGRVLAGITTDYLNWRASFLLLGSLTLAGSAAVARWLPRERNAPPIAPHDQDAAGKAVSSTIVAALGLLAGRRMLAVYAVGFNVLFSLVAIFTYITFHLSAPPFSLGITAISWLFSVYLVGLVVTPLAGASLARIGLRTSLVAATALALSGVLLTLSPHLLVVLIGLVLCSSGVFVSQAAATSYLRVAAPPHFRTLAAGLYLSAYYLGGTAGGEVPSWLWSRPGSLAGWTGCVMLVGALQCVTMVVAWWGWD